MNKKPTVTIGIPAYNEEANIGNLLKSLVSQNTGSFKLESILVANDASTDNTVKMVKKYARKYKLIKLIDDGKRLGKATRLNNFYKSIESDILISFDADVILANNGVLEEIIKTYENNKVGLVGGYDKPANPRNWVEKMCATWIEVWDQARTNLKDPHIVHNHISRISSSKRELFKKVRYAKDLVEDDPYLYLKAKEMGYEFRFASRAVVYYRVPATLGDFFKQSARFLSSKGRLARIFGDWIYEEFEISSSDKINALWVIFKKEPIYLPIAIFFQIILRLHVRFIQTP